MVRASPGLRKGSPENPIYSGPSSLSVMKGFGRARVGGTKLEISRVGLGGGALGYMYEPVPDDVAVATVRKALDIGIHHVDTAPLYGQGTSERRVGQIGRASCRGRV